MRQKCGRETCNNGTRQGPRFSLSAVRTKTLTASWSRPAGLCQRRNAAGATKEQMHLRAAVDAGTQKTKRITLNSQTTANAINLSKNLLFTGQPLPIVKVRALAARFNRPCR